MSGDKSIAWGFDIGIASCGWAVLDMEKGEILGLGAHCFDPAEERQNGKIVLKNKQRREKRGMRRVIRRRAQRMQKVRACIKKHRLLEDPSHQFFQKLGKTAPDPWRARVEGLERALTPKEMASALIHIAKHRGFKSNSKSDRGNNAPDDSKKALSALSKSEERKGLRTFAQMILNDEPYQGRRRNRDAEYTHTPRRDWSEEEIKAIFEKQRKLGQSWASEALENDYLNAAFFQRSLQSSEKLVGNCPFEPSEKRAAKYSYSFERFRLLQKLVWIEISTETGKKSLSQEQIARAMKDFGGQRTLTYSSLKKKIGLSKTARFIQAPTDKTEKEGVIAPKSKICGPGSYLLRDCLGAETWQAMISSEAGIENLDKIAWIMTFNEALDDIGKKIRGLGLDAGTTNALIKAAEDGKFNEFKGTGHISAKAARKIIPGLKAGKVYSDACKLADYDHAKTQEVKLEDIRNPVVTRSLNRALKQAEILRRAFPEPALINIEMLREVGKSAEERGEIERGLDKRTTQKEKNREDFLKKLSGQTRVNAMELESFELLMEQGCECAFCAKSLRPRQIVAGNETQIEHIYPRSRSHDNSFVNKVLACIKCNQDKKKRTPWEWYQAGGFPTSWEIFEARTGKFNCKKEKKKRLRNKSFAEREQDFLNRNKNDTSQIARLLAKKLKEDFSFEYDETDESKRRVFARPGKITAMLRRSWGLNQLLYDKVKISDIPEKEEEKKKKEKERADDRHHALDALVVACTTESMLQRLTKANQALEDKGIYKWTPDIAPPWGTKESFRQDVARALEGWLVCRTETRRVRGKGHDETVRRRRKVDGKYIVYERKKVEDLKEADLKRIPDGEATNKQLVQILGAHLAKKEEWKKAHDQWKKENKDREKEEQTPEPPALPRPRLPRGAEIRKVRLETKTQTVRQINPQAMGGKKAFRQGGFVENASIARVDVYKVEEKRGKIKPGYYLVPIYNWQIMNKKLPTPMQAIKGGTAEENWPEMQEENFLFSLYKDSYIKIVKKDGTMLAGYYRSVDRAGGSLAISPHNKRHPKDMERGIGVLSLKSFRKFHVDRLGETHKVKQEKWPGRPKV